MFSTFIAQWESAHANALQLLGKFAAQTTGDRKSVV